MQKQKNWQCFFGRIITNSGANGKIFIRGTVNYKLCTFKKLQNHSLTNRQLAQAVKLHKLILTKDNSEACINGNDITTTTPSWSQWFSGNYDVMAMTLKGQQTLDFTTYTIVNSYVIISNRYHFHCDIIFNLDRGHFNNQDLVQSMAKHV